MILNFFKEKGVDEEELEEQCDEEINKLMAEIHGNNVNIDLPTVPKEPIPEDTVDISTNKTKVKTKKKKIIA